MYEEVTRALGGEASSMERINERGELIVSVAVPIQRYRAVLGALMLSTRGGDIDRIVRAERIAILQVFLVALGVTILLSVLLAGTIAEPVRRLAQAAETVRRGKNARAQIPDFTERHDEIGELSGAFREMTNALYSRIDAIESFAADVAHEIKNPLTSLRSAIETFRLAKDESQKDRLMEIIQEDVRRIDRLISDISNASRLDAELSRGDRAEVNIATLLETVCALFNESGAAGSARVKLEVDPGAPGRDGMVVKGFDTRLGQVVRNLIDNALSFSPEGGTVRVAGRPRTRPHRDPRRGRGPRHRAGKFRTHLRPLPHRPAGQLRRAFRPRSCHLPPDRRGAWRHHPRGQPNGERQGRGRALHRRTAGSGIGGGHGGALYMHGTCVSCGARAVLLRRAVGLGQVGSRLTPRFARTRAAKPASSPTIRSRSMSNRRASLQARPPPLPVFSNCAGSASWPSPRGKRRRWP